MRDTTITLRLTDVATGRVVEHTADTPRDARQWLLDFAAEHRLHFTVERGGGRGALKRRGGAETIYRWQVA